MATVSIANVSHRRRSNACSVSQRSRTRPLNVTTVSSLRPDRPILEIGDGDRLEATIAEALPGQFPVRIAELQLGPREVERLELGSRYLKPFQLLR